MELTPITGFFIIIIIAIIANLFLKDIIIVGINIIILYLIFIKLNAEIKKRKMQKTYMISFFISCAVLIIIGNFLQKLLIWWITTIIITTIVFAEIYKRYNKMK